MLQFSRDQIDSLSDAHREGFVKRARSFLAKRQSHWIEGKSEVEVDTFIDRIIAFAAEREIVTRKCVLRLIGLQIETGFAEPLPVYAELKLTQAGMSEARRIDSFEVALRSEDTLVAITLDSDLETLSCP